MLSLALFSPSSSPFSKEVNFKEGDCPKALISGPEDVFMARSKSDDMLSENVRCEDTELSSCPRRGAGEAEISFQDIVGIGFTKGGSMTPRRGFEFAVSEQNLGW